MKKLTTLLLALLLLLALSAAAAAENAPEATDVPLEVQDDDTLEINA